MSDTVLAAILGGVFTAIVTFLGTWWLTKSDHATKVRVLQYQADHLTEKLNETNQASEKLARAHEHANAQIKKLTETRDKYERVKKALGASHVVKQYYQPVILAGPTRIGKTSLLTQWHAPWFSGALRPTEDHSVSEVPIYDFMAEAPEPHFADPEILTPVQAHLLLRVHDFPGERRAQEMIRHYVQDETQNLHRQTKSNLGVVLICMFNAEEAHLGVSGEMFDYYNGDLFKQLRLMVSHNEVSLDRLVLVFNKYDLLKSHYADAVSDVDLLKLCISKFDRLLDPLKGVCNPEKVCEVFTVLPREDMHLKNRGATIVKGEAARRFVQVLAGNDAGAPVLTETRATNFSRDKFT